MPLFSFWLEGIEAEDVVSRRRSELYMLPTALDAGMFNEMLLQDTKDHYRNFEVLEKFFCSPETFAYQTLIIIPDQMFLSLLEKYYEFHDDVFRDLAGKKLKQKTKHTLDDLSDRIHVPIKCCRREFDNIRRIYDFVLERKEENKPIGSLTEVIQQQFLISTQLAERYSRYIFLTYNLISTQDKRLRFLTVKDIEYIASVLMSKWTTDKLQLDIDRKFKEDLKELRTYMLSEKVILETYKSLVGAVLKQTFKDEKKISQKFQVILKALLNIGAGLSKQNEFEDILEDMEEKVLDNCVRLGLSVKELEAFFQALASTFGELMLKMSPSKHKKKFTVTWQRFLEAIHPCILYMLSVRPKEDWDK